VSHPEEFFMRKQLIILAFSAAVYAACGDDGGGGPNPAPNALAPASGNNQGGVVDAALANAFCARVTAGGSNKEGVTVNWTTPDGGSMTPTSVVSAADGIACSTLTLGTTAGAQTAQAAVPGATGSPVTFNATASADVAATIASAGGDNQNGNINTDLATPLSVLVADQFGNSVNGTLVSWAVTSGSASVTPTGGNTNAAGIATTVVTLGGTAGPIVIEATATGLNGSPVIFDATSNTPPPLPTAITITVVNNSFGPPVDTVAVGGTVTWNWDPTGGVLHTVTSINSPSFVSDPAGAVASPHSYGPITFNTPGTYDYYCTQHGLPGDPPTVMAGRIVVM
jgi:plastocyanin